MVSRKTDVGKVGRCAGKKGLVIEAKPGEGDPASTMSKAHKLLVTQPGHEAG